MNGLQRRSRATRARILDAATPLFLREGYLTTTMGAIAGAAGVSVQTLYMGFGSKLGILSAALDVAIAGDHEPVPLLDRAWVRELAEAPDGPQAVRLFVAQVRAIADRTYPLLAVLQGAAAGEAGVLLAANRRDRRHGIQVIAELLEGKPGFTPGLSVTKAADVIYGLAGEAHYGQLVGECGWTSEEWEQWCGDTLARLLFPGRQ